MRQRTKDYADKKYSKKAVFDFHIFILCTNIISGKNIFAKNDFLFIFGNRFISLAAFIIIINRILR